MFRNNKDSFLERTAGQALAERLKRQQLAHDKFDEFRREHTSSTREQYEEDKIHAIEEGGPVWMLRNPDADFGYVFDFFNHTEWVGYIDYSGVFAATIVVPTKELPESVVVLDTIDHGSAQENLMEAIERLEALNMAEPETED